MIIYVGIDDTDNLESRGTGFIARNLGKGLVDDGYGDNLGISRHQLFVSPEIPYTSHNSSLCIKLDSKIDDMEKLADFCSSFLAANCAEGSDPGLCIAAADMISEEIVSFGRSAKSVVLTKDQANALAKSHGIHLSEHGGTGGGIIGALAGVGLAAWGNDGRFVWLRGIRDMEGVFTAEYILNNSGVECIMTLDGDKPEACDKIDVGEWFRPVLLNGKPTLIIEKNDDIDVRWRIIDREKIKAKY